jgi:hypothetical protein
MVDPKDPKDPKGLNRPAPSDTQARPEKDEIAEEDLGKVSGGAIAPPHKPPPGTQ